MADFKLTDIIAKQFSDDEQRQFVDHFKLYAEYGPNSGFVMDIDNIWKWIGFARKDHAKRFLKNNFIDNIDYIVLITDPHRSGGQNKENIKMTVNTFKSFCLLANTEKAKQTRFYYCKLESIVFEYIKQKEEQKLKTLEEALVLREKELEKKAKKQNQDTLVKAYDKEPLVYLIQFTEPDEENYYRIKIGETEDIKQRLSAHRIENKDAILLDVFPCIRAHNLEQYILKRPDVAAKRIPGTEIIEISNDFTYENLKHIIEKSLNYFNKATNKTQNFEEMKVLTELLNITQDEIVKQEIRDKLVKLIKKDDTTVIDDDSDEESEEVIESIGNRRVYKFDPTDLSTPIETFNSLREAARSISKKDDGQIIHDYHIRTASQNNTLLCGHRWYYIEDQLEDELIVPAIPPTQEPVREDKKSRINGQIAQLNADKTKIITVFPNQAEVVKTMNIPSCSISFAMSTGQKSRGFYWIPYDQCSDEQKRTFTDPIPETKRNERSSKRINRVDPDTNEVVESFNSIQEIQNKYRICHKKINALAKSGDIYKGFKWLYVAATS